MRKTNIIEAYSQNGEVHVVIREHKSEEQLEKFAVSRFIKMKEFMKKEAAKPLLLLRTE